MPVRDIRRYAALRTAGDSTIPARIELLLAHRQSLNAQIARLQEHEARLAEKIELYRQALSRGDEILPLAIFPEK